VTLGINVSRAKWKFRPRVLRFRHMEWTLRMWIHETKSKRGEKLCEILGFPDFVKLYLFLGSMFCLINLLRLVVMLNFNIDMVLKMDTCIWVIRVGVLELDRKFCRSWFVTTRVERSELTWSETWWHNCVVYSFCDFIITSRAQIHYMMKNHQRQWLVC